MEQYFGLTEPSFSVPPPFLSFFSGNPQLLTKFVLFHVDILLIGLDFPEILQTRCWLVAISGFFQDKDKLYLPLS
jgi:hypothetical protein